MEGRLRGEGRRRAGAAIAGCVAMVCAAPVVAAPAAAPGVQAEQGLRRPGGFLTLSPAGVGLLPAYRVPFYLWSVDGGYHRPIGKVFAMQVGGYFEHGVILGTQLIHFGALGRFGGGRERSFGYALVRLGADINVKGSPLNSAGFGMSLGGGGMGMVHRVVGLGGEAAFDVWLDSRATQFLPRLRVFLALKF